MVHWWGWGRGVGAGIVNTRLPQETPPSSRRHQIGCGLLVSFTRLPLVLFSDPWAPDRSILHIAVSHSSGGVPSYMHCLPSFYKHLNNKPDSFPLLMAANEAPPHFSGPTSTTITLCPLDSVTPGFQLPGVQMEEMPPEPSHCPGALEKDQQNGSIPLGREV